MRCLVYYTYEIISVHHRNVQSLPSTQIAGVTIILTQLTFQLIELYFASMDEKTEEVRTMMRRNHQGCERSFWRSFWRIWLVDWGSKPLWSILWEGNKINEEKGEEEYGGSTKEVEKEKIRRGVVGGQGGQKHQEKCMHLIPFAIVYKYHYNFSWTHEQKCSSNIRLFS